MPPELALRPFRPDEAETVAGWIPDEAGAVMWGGPGVRWPVDAAQFATMLADKLRTMWTATQDGAIAGHCQLARDPRRRTVRLGRVAIAPSLRGRGLATPMVRLAVALAFRRDPALHRVELQVYAQNAAARAAYARAGFTLEGVLREDVPVVRADGTTQLWSTAVMAVLRPEWGSDQP